MFKDVALPVIFIVFFLAVGGAAWWWYLGSPPLFSREGTSTQTSSEGGDEAETPTSEISVAFLDTTGEMEGKARGCDKVVMVPFTIEETTAPLTMALFILFDIDTENSNGLFSYIARTNETLKFDHATMVDGTANIYLTGELTGLAGVCDDPRAAIQIEETALQFPTVERVQIYLNGEPTTLVPSQRGD